jgi:Fe-S-cluster-containing dehydrogenase component
MTSLPATADKKLGLVIDLDTCVGCQACVTSCKEWNTGGHMAPLTDINPYGADPDGVWFNRVHTYEHSCDGGNGSNRGSGNRGSGNRGSGKTVHFPRSCLHCETPACVTVCPTGASYKRAADGIVLVDEDKCIGCQLCSWACPYGARELDAIVGVMKKCTLCIDRIYNDNLEPEDRVPACIAACPTGARHFGDLGDPDSPVSRLVSQRGGVDLMPELGYGPVNKYLPPRPRAAGAASAQVLALESAAPDGGFLGWVDRMLSG